jgi:hypothetical protein
MNDIIEFDIDTPAEAIMNTYWENTFDPEQFASLDQFLDRLRANLWKFQKIGISLECCLSTTEKCERIVSVLKEKNLIKFK